MAEAEDLAGLLKAGSLPAPARIVDEVSVDRSSVKRTSTPVELFVTALLVVLAYMIFYYCGAGLVSNLALIANLFFLIGALPLGRGTDPSRNRIVLTIGMAVDANVPLRAHPRGDARWKRPDGRPERRLREGVQRHHRRQHHHLAHRIWYTASEAAPSVGSRRP